MKNAVFLESYSGSEEFRETAILKLPLESYVAFYIYRTCLPKPIALYFVHRESHIKDFLNLNITESLNFLETDGIPWMVTMCSLPAVLYEDTVITGLCAVARHLCKFRSTPSASEEHEEGLLGFRKSCLQAPNEVSIWTKFCEVELLRCVENLLSITYIKEVPTDLVRFENHLHKPVKVHNVYKIARNLRKESYVNKTGNDNYENNNLESNIKEDRTQKPRKWKSKLRKELEIDCSLNIGDLNVCHRFSEGPFLTLADLILLPLYHIIIHKFKSSVFKSVLPLTYAWYFNIISIPELQSAINLLNTLTTMSVNCDSLVIPKIEDYSLYKCDPKRHNPKKRLFTKEEDIENALNIITGGMELISIENTYDFEQINWVEVPNEANPAAGHLPEERMARKTQQLENLSVAVLSVAKEGDVIVDFCCGSGHLGILLAYLLPKCTIILLENKEQSLLRARKRVHDMGLMNVFFYQCNLDFFIGKFDVGVALHACGIASDLVLDKCLKAKAKFVLCPCCYGSLHATDRLIYPRSTEFAGLSVEQYLCIGHAADQTHEEHPLTERGDRCMAIIDSDRAHLAKEFGYKVTLSRLKPLSCTPKNNLLIGVPT